MRVVLRCCLVDWCVFDVKLAVDLVFVGFGGWLCWRRLAWLRFRWYFVALVTVVFALKLFISWLWVCCV